MTNNFKMIAIIILAVIALYIFQVKNSDYNLNKTISACMVGQKQTSKSFDVETAKKKCKEEIVKKLSTK